MPELTDEQICNAIDRTKPELCKAIRALFAGSTVHMFNFLETTVSTTGEKALIVCILAHEAPATVLYATAQGLDQAAQVAIQRMQKQQSKIIQPA